MTTRQTRNRVRAAGPAVLIALLAGSAIACAPAATPESLPVAAAAPVAAATTTATTTDEGAPVPGEGEDIAHAADAYLIARADGNAERAWGMLSPDSQGMYPDRAAFDAEVAETAPAWAALQASEPRIEATPRGDISHGWVATITGTVDPDGSPRVTAVPVVIVPGGGVDYSPAGVTPATWDNPSLAQGGTLGLAYHDGAQPLRVTVPEYAVLESVGIGGTTLVTTPVDGEPGAYTAELPSDTAPGQHTVVATYFTEGTPVVFATAVPFEYAPQPS